MQQKYFIAIYLFFISLISFGQKKETYVFDTLTRTGTYYDDSGRVFVRIIELEKEMDKHRHVLTYNPNGQKVGEFFDRNRIIYDTLRRWNKYGKLTALEIYTDTGMTAAYYDFETGSLSETGQYRFTDAPPKQMVVYDSASFDKLETVECTTHCLLRTGIWKTYYENGVVESEGKYLPVEFQGITPMRDSIGNIMVPAEKTSFEMIPDVIYASWVTWLKNGSWKYYNEAGQKTGEEVYEGGLLRKETTVNYLPDCDTLPAALVKLYDSYSPKKFKKIKKRKDLDPVTAFNIATYLRHKKDTSYFEWYQLYVTTLYGKYIKIHDKRLNPCMFYSLAKAYYYLDDYQQASINIQKAFKSNCSDTCMNFYPLMMLDRTQPDTTDWQKLIVGATFTVTSTVKKINPLLLDKFPRWKMMADTGGRFNASDNGGGTRHRLFFAANSGNYWIVSYEHGGRGYHTHCFFIIVKPHKILQVYEIAGPQEREFKKLEELMAAFSKQKIPLARWDHYDH